MKKQGDETERLMTIRQVECQMKQQQLNLPPHVIECG
jgi:hypothetical protein